MTPFPPDKPEQLETYRALLDCIGTIEGVEWATFRGRLGKNMPGDPRGWHFLFARLRELEGARLINMEREGHTRSTTRITRLTLTHVGALALEPNDTNR